MTTTTVSSPALRTGRAIGRFLRAAGRITWKVIRFTAKMMFWMFLIVLTANIASAAASRR